MTITSNETGLRKHNLTNFKVTYEKRNIFYINNNFFNKHGIFWKRKTNQNPQRSDTKW